MGLMGQIGLIDPFTLMELSPFKDSQWIWPDNSSWDLHNNYALFRKSFDLPRVPTQASLFITADQAYRLFVNGRYVGRGPARGFQASWPYDEIDLKPCLQRGRNTFAIRAYNPGRSTFQYLSQGFAGLLVAARWGKIRIVSDASWKATREPGVNRATVPSSLQLFDQEHIDLRAMAGDWTLPEFDDGAWEHPKERRWNCAPWYDLEPRGIPLLDERDMAPVRLLGIGEGKSAVGYGTVRDIVALRCSEDRQHQPAPPGLSFHPLLVTATGTGQFRSYLFDFGKTVVGSLVFEIEGARGGEILDTHLAETIDAKTLTLDQIIPIHCRMAFGDRLIAREGNLVHRFFHHYGFRYLAVTVRDATVDFRLNVRLNWIGYPLERKGSFISSDFDLNRIWEACAWTQQCCSLDAYVDTPWREQAQWWGDARVQAWNTFHLSGDARLFRRGIAQIADQTTPDGVTYGHAPTMAHECILPDFTLIWFLTIWDYYWQTGSTEPLTAHEETIEKALGYFRAHTDPRTGLVTYDERYWLFLDWADLFKEGAPTVYNLWLLLALEKLSLLYKKVRQPKKAAPLEAWAKRLRQALAKLVGKDGLMRDGIDRQGKIISETSIHAQTLAIIAKVEGIDVKTALDKILLPFLRGETKPKAVPSAYWVTYLFTVLSERGYGLDLVGFIKRHWLAMADYGGTWENFCPDRGETSHSHAWSAHPLYHLMQIIGGVNQLAPNWSRISFRPVFFDASNATTVPTPHGPIRAGWKQKGDGFEVWLKLPVGITAAVELPGIKQRVVGRGRWKVTPIFLEEKIPLGTN
jgi:hypothetical protein